MSGAVSLVSPGLGEIFLNERRNLGVIVSERQFDKC